MTDVARAKAGWYPDPTGRHEHRFWDGAAWTINVADNGVTGIDERVRETTPAAATTTTSWPGAAWQGTASPLPGRPIGVDPPSTRRSNHRTRSMVSAVILVVAAAAGVVVARTVLSASPDDTTTTTMDSGYPAAIELNFIDSCIDGGGTRHACRCALTKIESDYDIDEFEAAEREYTETGVLPEVIRNAALDCLPQQVQQN
jgi:hypothetical protein